ncbi:hypothetical protein ACUOFC_59860, partial [Escherichia sp. TWPC-MK]
GVTTYAENIGVMAWGEIKSDQQWKVLSKLKNGYQDSLFTSPEVARNVAKPLVRFDFSPGHLIHRKTFVILQSKRIYQRVADFQRPGN